ncbi:hypothetical protein ACPCSE_29400 [Streptomyces cellulosae]
MKVTKLNRFLFPAAAVAVAVALTGCSGADEPSEQGAAVMCEEFIKKDERIKSPGSLKFSGVSETKIRTLSDKKPWKYQVNGFIDSQNSFGAMKRNKYRCVVSTKDNDTWTKDELTYLTHN